MADSYSYNTSTESHQNKDLTLGQKWDVPNCGLILSTAYGKHPRYVSKCPQLKKNQPKVNIKRFKKTKRRCQHCLVKAQKSSECIFSDWNCKREIIKTDGQKEVCGKPHHWILHDPDQHGKIAAPVQNQQQ